MNDNSKYHFESVETAALETATGGLDVRAFLALQKKIKDPSYSLLKDGYDLKQVPGTTDRWIATRPSAGGGEQHQLRAHDSGWQLIPFIR